jgi:hypothetical protein
MVVRIFPSFVGPEVLKQVGQPASGRLMIP